MTNSSSSSGFNIGEGAKGIIGQTIENSTYIEKQININVPPAPSKEEKAEEALNSIDEGNEYLRLNNLEKAIECFNRAKKLDDVPFAYIGLGTSRCKQGNIHLGKKEYDRAKSRYKDAIEAFEKAKSLFSSDERFRNLVDQQERLNKLIQSTSDKISDLDKRKSRGFRLW
jgi:tetratricopeptide (TPR) repeat protein